MANYELKLAPEHKAYFEAMASKRGLSVLEWIRSIVVLAPAPKSIKCSKCGETQTQDKPLGIFSELDPNPPKGSPFRTTIAIRVFANRWVEMRTGDALTYSCSRCTTWKLKPAAWFISKLIPKPGADADVDAFVNQAGGDGAGDIISEIFNEPVDDAEEQRALPPRKDPP